MTISSLDTNPALYPATLNEAFVRAFVARGSGLDSKLVIPSEQGAPVPNALFASVLLITDDANDNPTALEIVRNGKYFRAYQQTRLATFSIQFYGKNAVRTCSQFCLWVGTDKGLQAQRKMPDNPPEGEEKAWPDFTSMRVKMPLSFRRISGIVDQTWEERAMLEMPCLYGVAWLADAETIGDVSIELDAGGNAKLQITDIEIGRNMLDSDC